MSRHVSRILFMGPRSQSAAIHLGLPLPTGSSGLPASIGRAALERSRSTFTCDPVPSWPCSGWGLPSRPSHLGRWWSLTPPFHPYRGFRRGGLFSVALSRGSPLVAVNNHPALWSPDFPRQSPAAAALPTHPLSEDIPAAGTGCPPVRTLVDFSHDTTSPRRLRPRGSKPVLPPLSAFFVTANSGSALSCPIC